MTCIHTVSKYPPKAHILRAVEFHRRVLAGEIKPAVRKAYVRASCPVCGRVVGKCVKRVVRV